MDKEAKPNGEIESTEIAQSADMTEPNSTVEVNQKTEPIAVSEPTEMTEMDVDMSKPDDAMPSIDTKPISIVEPKEEIQSIKEDNLDVGVTPIVKVETQKSTKKHFSKLILHIIFILVIAFGAAGAAYLWRENTANDIEKQKDASISALQELETSLKAELATEKAKTSVDTPVETTCTATAPSASVIASIKSSITSGNTAALEGYMATSVNVILAATEGVGPSTPAVAVTNVTNFISGTTAWDFALSASTLSSYSGGGYAQYFPSIAVVGKSSSNKVISFSFDCDGKISTVFMAASGELL